MLALVPLPPPQLDTLCYAHLRGFMYFDLKPANVMFGGGRDTDTVYLLDWGCCRPYKDMRGDMLTAPVDAGNDTFRSLHAHALSRT